MPKPSIFFIKRLKQALAPMLLSPSEYWAYIQTRQAYLAALPSVLIMQLVLEIIVSWALLLTLLNTVLSEKTLYLLGFALSVIYIVWYFMTIYKKRWYGFTALLLSVLGLIIASCFYQSGIIAKTFTIELIIIAYLVVSHLIMLMRVKKLADETR